MRRVAHCAAPDLDGMTAPMALTARPRQRILFCGRTALITDIDGHVREGDEGLYFENTRVLSTHHLTIGGRDPNVIVEAEAAAHASLGYIRMTDLSAVPGALLVERSRFVGAGLVERLRLEHHALEPAGPVEIALELGADFADLREARQGERKQYAPVERSWDGAKRELVLRYRHARLDRALAVRVLAGDASYRDGALRFVVHLGRRVRTEIVLSYEPMFDGQRHRVSSTSFARPDGPTAFASVTLREEAPRLFTTNPSVTSTWETAIRDLTSLPFGEPDGPALPIAGVPMYQQIFGRDALTVGLQSAMVMPSILRDCLYVHARWQGRRVDPSSEEEPGRILHQARRGPLSALGLDRFGQFYGEYTATAAFLMGLGHHLAWTGDVEFVRGLLPAARRALRWILEYADRDGDGFLEYAPTAGVIKNEGWKDSDEAIVTEEGEIVQPPIGTCEIQGYAYAGLRQGALALLACGARDEGFAALRRASALRARFNRVFWMPTSRFYALALGPDKALIRTVASNPLHLLATGIVPRGRAAAVAQRLLAEDMFSGWGIRTLSAENPRYDPFAYQRGSVWPVEMGPAAVGFARYGLVDALHRVAEGAFAAASLYIAHRLPEVLGGTQRDADHPHPGFYRGSNEPQAWSAGAVVLIVQALLGIRPVAPLRLLLVDPQLPPWLPWVRLEGLRVGPARVGLEFWRERNGRSRFHLTERSGTVHVLQKPLGRAMTLSRRVP